MKLSLVFLIAISSLIGIASPAAAQPAPGSFTIGVLSVVGLGDGAPPAFTRALREQGRNLTPVSRAAKTSNAELPGLAADLKPGDIPIEQATKFKTIVNLKTAAALGVDIPPILLAGADEVIE